MVKGQCPHSLSLHASEDSAGDKKQSDIFELISGLLSSADLFRDDFLTREDHRQRNVFTPSRWNQSEQSVQQNAVAHFRRGEPSNARIAGENSRLNVLTDVIVRPAANRVLIDGE